SVEVSPVHTFTNFGDSDSIYLITLTTSTSDGECVKQANWPMVIHPQVDVEFTFSESRDCTPFEVTFENLTVGSADYTWNFGDGTIINTPLKDSQTHTFENLGFVNIQEFNVSLYGENSDLCFDEVIKTVSVYPDIEASINTLVTEGCQPLDVKFFNNSQGASLYVWDFGDGSTSNVEEPLHTFMNTGSTDTTYWVKLLAVASNNVCEAVDSIAIKVYPYLAANFTIPDFLDCNPFDVVIENSSVNGTQFNWDFGDGNNNTTLTTDAFTYTFYNDLDYDNQRDYEITLEAVNGFGCTKEVKKTITVEPDILADFLASQVIGCHPLSVSFTNVSKGEAYNLWDFGDGTTSQQAGPIHVFNNTGTSDVIYTVWLYVTAANNECTDSLSVDITVHPYIDADFTFQDNINCHPSTVQLNNSSVGGAIYNWDFGDTQTATTNDLSTVSHEFLNISTSNIASYQVRLDAISGNCSSTVTKTIEVYPDIIAGFTPSIVEGCHPLKVSFPNTSSGGFTYKWDFDDGASSDQVTPTHTFNNYTGADITRQVQLIAASQYNCRDTITEEILIHPRPVARFESDRLIDCPPYDMKLTNTSLYGDTYTWFFGDGGQVVSTAAVVTHTYDNNTVDVLELDLVLAAETSYGCQDTVEQKVFVYPKTVADFTMVDAGCAPLTVSFQNESERGNIYLWDFGDESNLSVTDPIHIYHNLTGFDEFYEVMLTSISNYGCVDTKTDTVYVYAQPDAEFTATPTHQNYPDADVTLTNLSGIGDWNYSWDLGDGTIVSDQDPDVHTYTSWGDYNITLNVSSVHCSDEISHGIRIFPAPPQAGLDTVYPGCEPLEVQFRNNTLYGSDYLWDFDDGTTSTDFEPFHTFEKAGLYNVKLTATSEGGIDYIYQVIEVYKMPVLDFEVVPEEIMLPVQEARFFNLTEYADYYNWDFGDGSNSSEESPYYLYTEVGVYQVTLEAWTYDGCYDILTKVAGATVKGEGEIAYPTAFKPDLSGPNGGYYSQMTAERNNVFHPKYEGVNEYKLEIYNRWGQKLFESGDVNVGWDGYYNGVLCEQGVYVWQVSGTYNNGEPFRMVGDVTLLHHDNTQ
ncbi:PKD domain-containing protein, partial [Bacteroidota bacterium]